MRFRRNPPWSGTNGVDGLNPGIPRSERGSKERLELNSIIFSFSPSRNKKILLILAPYSSTPSTITSSSFVTI